MKVKTKHPYISSNPDILEGEPIVKETRIPVRAIVELWRMGSSPEEIKTKLPHLTLSQIFDALGYYDDNKDEINSYIEKNTIPESMIDPIVKNIE
jgi:uncharacterized protein (DUF433 family)